MTVKTPLRPASRNAPSFEEWTLRSRSRTYLQPILQRRVFDRSEPGNNSMADGNSNTFLGVIVGALLVGVIGIGGILLLSHKSAPSAPAVSVSLPASPAH